VITLTASRWRPLTFLLLLAVVTSALLVGVGTTPAEAATSSTIREAQTLLTGLGYPAGPVDGIDGPRTRQGLCAWRRLAGRDTHRGPLTSNELRALRDTTRLPNATAGRGVSVDKTCQTVYFRRDGRWRKVLIASTGKAGLPTNGTYEVIRKLAGWHNSSLYPDAQPNMYNSMYLTRSIAIHGSRSVPYYPASHGCVRVTPKGADYLYARLRVGDPVRVIGRW
jgi:hypothetical protein